MHLEHSPWYHFYVLPTVEGMAEVSHDTKLRKLEEQLKRVAGWLVPPDHHYVIVGDTQWAKLPGWAVREAEHLSGIAPVQDAGYGIVKQGNSYLLAFVGQHSKVHKHADEGTFVWFENKQQILTDTGKYAYRYDDPERKFAVSTRAHNTLMVDNQEFSVEHAYGSGIKATASADGWYAIVAENPLVEIQKVTHQRTWLYRPGEWLFLIDHVWAQKPHRYSRYLHFWYELHVQLKPRARFSTQLRDTAVYGADLTRSASVDARVIRNSKEPLQGVMYPYGTKPRPNDVLELSATAKNAVFVVGFRVGKPFPSGNVQVVDSDGTCRLQLPDQTVELTLEGSKTKLSVHHH